jgi:hypothetical protein
MDYSQFRPSGTQIGTANSKLYKLPQVKRGNNQPFAAQLKAAIESGNKLIVNCSLRGFVNATILK